MKGVVLAGGLGTRLDPLTKAANKHLLPVYDRPMISFAIEALRACDIDDIVLVTGTADVPAFQRVLGDGRAAGLDRLTYAGQDRPGGIAQALGLAQPVVSGEAVAVLLGDNVFERSLAPVAAKFRASPRGARLVLATVDDPRPYGVALFEGGRLVRVIEKPKDPPSSQIVTGMYFFDAGVFDVVPTLRPSARGELEITDIVNHYVSRGAAAHDLVNGYWIDCGESIAALHRAGNLVAERGANRAG